MNRKKNILIVTSRFPFLPGEFFFESELPSWLAKEALSVRILPINFKSHLVRRNGFEELRLLVPSETRGVLERLGIVLRVLCSLDLYREILNLVKRGLFGKRSVVSRLFKSLYLYQEAALKMKKVISNNKGYFDSIDVIYFYWNSFSSLALAKIIREYKIETRIISRLHGGDLYEERYEGCYYPLKRRYIGIFDELYFLSEDARKYAVIRYGLNLNSCHVSSLGVKVNEQLKLTNRGTEDRLTILSISNLIPLKRVDLIIRALSELRQAGIYSGEIKWVHIGIGPLLNELILLASKLLNDANIDYQFVGALANKDVLDYLDSGIVDVFVNASSFEGVPVSIMEAMSAGIPVVATDVGSVSELVSQETGCLLNESPTALDIAEGIVDVISRNQNHQLSNKAHQHVYQNFNAIKNYENFIAMVICEDS